MIYTFVGLGNPGEEYENTRHNTGRIILELIRKDIEASDWKFDKKINAEISKGKVGGKPVVLVLPNTYMNNSGKSVKLLVKSLKDAEKLLVIYDDLDLPFGSAKMSFNKSSGGHRGLDSVIKALKTEKFARIRVGMSASTPSGKLKKPQGEEKVLKFIMAKFKPEELTVLKKIFKKTSPVLETFVSEGLGKAMTEFNS